MLLNSKPISIFSKASSYKSVIVTAFSQKKEHHCIDYIRGSKVNNVFMLIVTKNFNQAPKYTKGANCKHKASDYLLPIGSEFI